jgi:hypothetical protein
VANPAAEVRSNGRVRSVASYLALDLTSRAGFATGFN